MIGSPNAGYTVYGQDGLPPGLDRLKKAFTDYFTRIGVPTEPKLSGTSDTSRS